MANPTPKTPRKQHSVWLMLGGAMLVSVFGWAEIVRQTEGPVQTDMPTTTIAVVELPAAQSTDRGVSAQAPVSSTRTQSEPVLRRVVRPVLRSHSSN